MKLAQLFNSNNAKELCDFGTCVTIFTMQLCLRIHCSMYKYKKNIPTV